MEAVRETGPELAPSTALFLIAESRNVLCTFRWFIKGLQLDIRVHAKPAETTRDSPLFHEPPSETVTRAAVETRGTCCIPFSHSLSHVSMHSDLLRRLWSAFASKHPPNIDPPTPDTIWSTSESTTQWKEIDWETEMCVQYNEFLTMSWSVLDVDVCAECSLWNQKWRWESGWILRWAWWPEATSLEQMLTAWQNRSTMVRFFLLNLLCTCLY